MRDVANSGGRGASVLTAVDAAAAAAVADPAVGSRLRYYIGFPRSVVCLHLAGVRSLLRPSKITELARSVGTSSFSRHIQLAQSVSTSSFSWLKLIQ